MLPWVSSLLRHQGGRPCPGFRPDSFLALSSDHALRPDRRGASKYPSVSAALRSEFRRTSSWSNPFRVSVPPPSPPFGSPASRAMCSPRARTNVSARPASASLRSDRTCLSRWDRVAAPSCDTPPRRNLIINPVSARGKQKRNKPFVLQEFHRLPAEDNRCKLFDFNTERREVLSFPLRKKFTKSASDNEFTGVAAADPAQTGRREGRCGGARDPLDGHGRRAGEVS